LRTLNLGILAHVDAGKTTMTERLLYAAGVIDEVGSVDDGTTRTDTLALERQRGITIRSAVVSFVAGDVIVNLIDTPGHPDFIAEVERVLGVLDGVVLVVSAVEGVQAQTRVLMRTLQRLSIPVLFFVNKIDRRGARPGAAVAAIEARLTPAIVPMTAVRDPGTPAAAPVPSGDGLTTRLRDVLTRTDDALLAACVAGDVPLARLRAGLARQSRRALVHPVFFGSASTGHGVPELIDGITELLPATAGDPGAPVSGTVFKVDRGSAGEKLAYLRVVAGTLRTRDRIRYGTAAEGRVTGLTVFGGGTAGPGRIAVVSGLTEVRVGDPVGVPPAVRAGARFAPPTLETVVVPAAPAQRGAVHRALSRLAEQDPLIDLRQDDVRRELSVSLYGEVQKQVIEAWLADEGLPVTFRRTTTLCVERVVGTGADAAFIGHPANPFRATVGLRVEPAREPAQDVEFRLGVELGSMPLGFFTAVEDAVRATLRQGLCGWPVTCRVTMTHSGFAPPPSTAGDFRNLTPLILMSALRRAGTVVCAPRHRFRLEAPADAALAPVLARLGAVVHTTTPAGSAVVLAGDLPAAAVHELQQRVPGLTRGEGVLECGFDRWEPVRGRPPVRARTDHNPLNRQEYLRQVARRLAVN
jgi:ribosomal protection tetracycline resistance protein